MNELLLTPDFKSIDNWGIADVPAAPDAKSIDNWAVQDDVPIMGVVHVDGLMVLENF